MKCPNCGNETLSKVTCDVCYVDIQQHNKKINDIMVKDYKHQKWSLRNIYYYIYICSIAAAGIILMISSVLSEEFTLFAKILFFALGLLEFFAIVIIFMKIKYGWHIIIGVNIILFIIGFLFNGIQNSISSLISLVITIAIIIILSEKKQINHND